MFRTQSTLEEGKKLIDACFEDYKANIGVKDRCATHRLEIEP